MRHVPDTGETDDAFDTISVVSDATTLYLQEECKIVENPLEWWKLNQKRFPRLLAMALETLAIPASSSESERTFSQARITYGLNRHSLGNATVERLQTL